MKKQLLIETVVVNPQDVKRAGGKYLVESAASGALLVTLPVTRLDERNLNERVYSTPIMENAIRSAKTAFENRELLSSANEHPTETAYVTPGDASHIVVDAWVQDGLLYNRWEILETTNGNNLKALIKAEASFGVSIRGLGSVDSVGNILDDYEYLGTDCVADPSARLRVKAEVVKESRALFPPHSKPPKGESTMKTKESTLKFLREQKVLLQADLKSDKMAAYQRLSQVENTLSESTLPAQDLASVYREWEDIKSEAATVLTSTAQPLNEAAQTESAKEMALLKKLLDSRTRQLATLLTSVEKMTERLRESAQQYHQLRRENRALRESGKRSTARKGDRRLTQLVAKNEALALGNRKLRERLIAANYATDIAVEAAAQQAYSAKVAIREAAKQVKKVKKAKQEAARAARPTASLRESLARRPVGSRPAGNKKTTFEESAKKRAPVPQGEHGIRGWI